MPPINPLDPDQAQEMVEVPGLPDEPEPEIVELPDGSVQVSDPEAANPAPEGEFYANLAEMVPLETRQELCSKYLELIKVDQESRQKRDEQYREGLERTGMSDETTGGAEFEGASRVVHPTLAEACVDFSARSSKELLPPNGPVKTYFLSEVPPEVRQQAEQRTGYLNYLFLNQEQELQDVIDQTLTQVPLGGSQFVKIRWDAYNNRPAPEFVPIDNVFVPFTARSFYSAQRITHRYYLSKEEYMEQVESGAFYDAEVELTGGRPEFSKSAEASAKIEGKEEPSSDLDASIELYEINCLDTLEDVDGARSPYLITINKNTEKVVSIYRNWEQSNPSRERLHWLVAFGFIPWRGVFQIGLPHLIGGLAVAATGALRALLDSAHINNAASAIRIKGAGFGGQNPEIVIGQITEIEAAPGIDDIRKTTMPLPFNPPSEVLFNLLGWLTDAAKGVVTTAEEKIADASNNMPVGTAQALIEQGAQVYSAIFARLHRSMKRLIATLLQAGRLYGPQELQQLCTDMDGVVLVSDPNIFSETQRVVQAQTLLQLANESLQGQDPNAAMQTDFSKGGTGQFNIYAVRRRVLETLKIPNIDEVLPPPLPGPQPTPAYQENVKVFGGETIRPYVDQDHFAHIVVHVDFLKSVVNIEPMVLKVVTPLIDHLCEHVAFLYGQWMEEGLTVRAGLPGDQLRAPEFYQQAGPILDQLAAKLSPLLNAQMMMQLSPLKPVIDEALTALDAAIERTLPPADKKLLRDSQAQLQMVATQTEDTRSKAEMAKLNLARQSVQDVRQDDSKERDLQGRMEIEAAKIANDPSILLDGVLPPTLGQGWSEQSDRVLEQGPIPEPEIEGPGESEDGEDESGEDAQEAGEG
jgi:hypothetical protein